MLKKKILHNKMGRTRQESWHSQEKILQLIYPIVFKIVVANFLKIFIIWFRVSFEKDEQYVSLIIL